MSKLPGDFNEPPISFSDEEIRVSYEFQQEPALKKAA